MVKCIIHISFSMESTCEDTKFNADTLLSSMHLSKPFFFKLFQLLSCKTITLTIISQTLLEFVVYIKMIS